LRLDILAKSRARCLIISYKQLLAYEQTCDKLQANISCFFFVQPEIIPFYRIHFCVKALGHDANLYCIGIGDQMAKIYSPGWIATREISAWSPGSIRKFLAIMTVIAVAVSFGEKLRAAPSPPQPATGVPVEVFSSTDETAALIETVSDGAVLTPMLEMMGAGGVKWFLVKTPAGNVGWIRAGENAAARQVVDHFRALPKESTSIAPAGHSPETAAKPSARGGTTAPIQVRGRHIIVAVTFNDSVTGNLVLDTGAGQTMISKRIANNLRLYSNGAGTRVGIGGAVSVSTATLDAIRVGEANVKNLRVSIHDLPYNAFEEGLLGMDFLGRFHMSLDMEKQVLILLPRS